MTLVIFIICFLLATTAASGRDRANCAIFFLPSFISSTISFLTLAASTLMLIKDLVLKSDFILLFRLTISWVVGTNPGCVYNNCGFSKTTSLDLMLKVSVSVVSLSSSSFTLIVTWEGNTKVLTITSKFPFLSVVYLENWSAAVSSVLLTLSSFNLFNSLSS